mmetsp:Transcript_19274/g.53752  ORF Transcript_19274/g.53752 Transcript_19274/m.53752 type:complete len:180 (-) Transcript_19274:258-797(-)|eukprot:CAMPEP_0117662610 /NCGR_PEP_ID=MMETSP0804-20121206/8143_1 /TAXON_ID=1074897 /ORGANISM="Tetraselmis astigmatica, Strain CCMP880" /LENGTH=179 /DNA_ID=CAMNT_0005469517 /DNA_START=227 /DNA_END=766 /DNA_ORIENTATION=+
MNPPQAGDGSHSTVQQLLLEGRARIQAGDVGGAVQCVMAAVEMVGGQESVLPTLSQALQRWRAGAVTASDLTDLSNLLSAVTINAPDTAGPSLTQEGASSGYAVHPHSEAMAVDEEPANALQKQDQATVKPILAETGRQGITTCAVSDGSSYVCRRCGGVVPMLRQAQHEQFWCQQLHQ